MPSFKESSFATRSSPQVTFSLTIRAMSCRISFGTGGRPPRDFQRQYHLNPLRCQRRKVLVLTTTSAWGENMPIQLRTDTSAAEHNLRKFWPFAPNPVHFADCTRFLRTTPAFRRHRPRSEADLGEDAGTRPVP